MKSVTIKGYIARDKDNLLCLYETEPYLDEKFGCFVDKFESYFLSLNEQLFPDITYENSPKEVKITITVEKDG